MIEGETLEQFIASGFVPLRGAVPLRVVKDCQDVIWDQLATRGITRDRATWTAPVVRIDCPWGGPFKDAGMAPVLWEAYDALIGLGKWRRLPGVGGTIPVRFPSQDDPGDAGWHVDGSYDVGGKWWLNVRTRERGLLALFLLTDVDERHAPTRILVGSHRDVPRVLAPAGDEGMPFDAVTQRLPASTFARELALATGRAGDVFVCHPFLVHAASWPHVGTEARMIAQPGIALIEPLSLLEDDLSPVAQAIRLGLA